MNLPNVAWFTNCWEGDYRHVLRPEFLAGKLCMYDTQFDTRFVTVNNVRDIQTAVNMVQYCVDSGVIDGYFVVSEHQSNSFRKLGIDASEVRRVENFTNWISVAITESTCDYLVHCAADITFTGNRNWVTEGIGLLELNDNLIMATPKSGLHSAIELKQSDRDCGSYWLHPGITDTCFVLKRSEVSRPIYNVQNTRSSEFPLSSFGACWEERLDAYVRQVGLYRAIMTDVTWNHWGHLGASYPRRNLFDRILSRLQRRR